MSRQFPAFSRLFYEPLRRPPRLHPAMRARMWKPGQSVCSISLSRRGSGCLIDWTLPETDVDRAIREEGERLRQAFPWLDERRSRGSASVRLAGWRRLWCLDCPPDPLPHVPAPCVAAFEHQVLQAGGFELGVGTVLLNEQIGSPPDIKVGDHRRGRSSSTGTPCAAAHLVRGWRDRSGSRAAVRRADRVRSAAPA